MNEEGTKEKKYKKGLTHALLQFLCSVAWYIYIIVNQYDVFVAVVLLIATVLYAWNNYDFVNRSRFFKVTSLVFMIIMIGLILLHLAVYFKLIPNVWWLSFSVAVCITYTFVEFIDHSGMEL